MTDKAEPSPFEALVEALRVMDSIKRTVVCEIGKRLQVEALITRYDMDQWWTVHESAFCPAGKLILINHPPSLI